MKTYENFFKSTDTMPIDNEFDKYNMEILKSSEHVMAVERR